MQRNIPWGSETPIRAWIRRVRPAEARGVRSPWTPPTRPIPGGSSPAAHTTRGPDRRMDQPARDKGGATSVNARWGVSSGLTGAGWRFGQIS